MKKRTSRWLNQGLPILMLILLLFIAWYGGIVPKYMSESEKQVNIH